VRALLLALVVACGGSSAPASGTLANAASTAPSSPAELDKRLVAALDKLPDDHYLYVHPAGWFTARHFTGKLTVYWTPSPALLAELEHKPSPIADTYPTEKKRFRAAISLQADPPEEEMDPTVIDRPPWADELGARLHHDLLTQGRASIAKLGDLIVDKSVDPAVQFHPLFSAAGDDGRSFDQLR